MIIPLGSLLVIISIFICSVVGVFYIPYYVGIFILLTLSVCVRKLVPNHLCYVKNFTSSVVFWLNYYLDVFVARMLNNAGQSSGVGDEFIQPNDVTNRQRCFESSDRLVRSTGAINSKRVANSLYKQTTDNMVSRSESTTILSPVHYNKSGINLLNSSASFSKLDSRVTGIKYRPANMVEAPQKSNSSLISNINRTSRLSQTYFDLSDGMKENCNVSYSPDSPWDDIRASPLRFKLNPFLHSTRENFRNQNNFDSRRYTGLSPEKRHNDSSSGVLTHQSKYAGPGQLPRVCLGRSNMLVTFSGTSLSKCVQSPVRAKPSTVQPKTRAYRLMNDSSPKFSVKFEETSRKRIRNSYEEDDDAAKRQCKADELSNSDNLEEDCVNLKRAREDSPKSDLDQHHQKPKKRVCNNEILSSLSSSKNFVHTSARKRKAAVVDWSRSSTPVQEKLFKKSIGSPYIVINNHQESDFRLTEDESSEPQEKLKQAVRGGSNRLGTPDENTSSSLLRNSVEKSKISNYTLFDIPITVSDTPVKENSPAATYADLNASLEIDPKPYTEKKTFDTKELEREAISKRLSSFWDAFGSVDVNKARNAMAPQKSTHKLNSICTQVATTSTVAVCVPSSVVTSILLQPSLSNAPGQDDKNDSVNLVKKIDSTKNVATSESIFTYGHSLSRSRELSPSLNLKNLVGNSAPSSSSAIATSSESVSGQSKFSFSSSPSAPVIGASDAAPLPGSVDLQRSKSVVSLSANVQSTSSSIVILPSELPKTAMEMPSGNVQLPPVQAVGTVSTPLPPPSFAPSNTLNATSSTPLFGFTSPFSSNFKNSSLDGKQNLSVANEKNVGSFPFSFNATAVTSNGKSDKSSVSDFSLPQTTSSAVSSTHLILKPSSSLATQPGQGGFSFPKFTSNNNQVDAAKPPSMFGSSQTSGEFSHAQTPMSGFGSVQSESGFGTVSTSGFGKVQTPSAKSGNVQETSTQGFGNIQVISARGSENVQTSVSGLVNVPSSRVTSTGDFGNVLTTLSGFGNVQVTSGGGFGSVHKTPSVFENARATPGGFGNAPATSAAVIGSVAPSPSNIFGTLQTATNSTAPFSFGAPNVQKTTSTFVFGACTVTTSSASTPIQSSDFGNAVTSSGQPQTSQLVLFTGGSDANKNQTSADGAKNIPIAFGAVNMTQKVGGFTFGSSHSPQLSTSTSVALSFGSNAAPSQASTNTAGKFSFGTPQLQSSGIPTTQPQLSFGSGSSMSLQLTKSPFSTQQPQQSETAAMMLKPTLSFSTPQSSFAIQQMQNSGAGMLAQQPQAPFGTLQQQTSGSSSLMQQPQTAGANSLAQNVLQRPSPFGAQIQQPQNTGGFSFAVNEQQQQQQQQHAASSSGLFGMSSQTSTFQFGSTPSGTSQSVGGFSFGNVATSAVPAVNFSAGSNTNSSFQVGTPGSFGGSSAGMFNIGSGSTAPRAKQTARNRRSLK